MAALPTQTVGVISGITCGQSFKNAFENALNAAAGAQIPVTYFDQVGYDSALLNDAVKCLTADMSIGLIATFGGTIAYNAAKNVATELGGSAKNFISLTAFDPNSAIPCLGGVSLESFTYNTPVPILATFTANNPNVSPATGLKARDFIAFAPGGGGVMPGNVTANTQYMVLTVTGNTFTFTDGTNAVTPTSTGTAPVNLYSLSNNRLSLITRHLGCNASDVSLLYHTGSRAAPKEVANWQQTRSTLPGIGTPPGPAVPINVRKDFSSVLGSVSTKAVIVSADPYFQENKEALIAAANKEPIFVCYPLTNYRNNGGEHKPSAGRTLLYGPRLEAAITQMGTLAANVLANVPTANQSFSKAAYSNPLFL